MLKYLGSKLLMFVTYSEMHQEKIRWINGWMEGQTNKYVKMKA